MDNDSTVVTEDFEFNEPDYEAARKKFLGKKAFWAPQWENDKGRFEEMFNEMMDAAYPNGFMKH